MLCRISSHGVLILGDLLIGHVLCGLHFDEILKVPPSPQPGWKSIGGGAHKTEGSPSVDHSPSQLELDY